MSKVETKKILIAPEKCPRCGAEFTCSKSGKCWCFSVSVPEQVRTEMEAKYDRCLCPACLKEVSEMGV
ncbi:MAG: cysteine-rich CWC family protein [Bacteroidales bacterium]|nr:cysteine-rich CWC family protein [Bacteroidales bacterium]